MEVVNDHVVPTAHQHHEARHQHEAWHPKNQTSKSNDYQKPPAETAVPQGQNLAAEAYSQQRVAQKSPHPPGKPYCPHPDGAAHPPP
ncbi:hypothetical protein NL436_27150, partial [Klebsiella pneumoniae]|nr:hypothetical protein [Klebsiella pneumoniae]